MTIFRVTYHRDSFLHLDRRLGQFPPTVWGFNSFSGPHRNGCRFETSTMISATPATRTMLPTIVNMIALILRR